MILNPANGDAPPNAATVSGQSPGAPGHQADRTPPAPAAAARLPAFETRALIVRYPGASRPALNGVTVSVPKGSMFAVLGPNGSGKSTLMRALLGIVKPASGECLVAGRATSAWRPRDLARVAGAVSQSESVVFPLSVREMVAMGRYAHLGPLGAEGPADREAIDTAMERCDVSALADRAVTNLSGGEFQRVRIARALAQQPESLALDEPTAGLDLGHEMSILRLLRGEVDQGRTVLLVTHHLDLAARFADQLLLLDESRVAAEGTPDEVIRADVLERVYRWRVSVSEDPVTGAPRVTPI